MKHMTGGRARGLGLVMALVFCTCPSAIGSHAQKPEVKVTKDEARAWDAAVHARVVANMADGQASPALVAPTRTSHRIPSYPKAARKAGLEGVVNVEARVGVNGRVKEFTVAKGDPQLVEAVKAAVSRWRYKPLKVEGTPYELKIIVDVSFNLR